MNRIRQKPWHRRCKECNVKRLTPKLMYLALGKFGSKK